MSSLRSTVSRTFLGGGRRIIGVNGNKALPQSSLGAAASLNGRNIGCGGSLGCGSSRRPVTTDAASSHAEKADVPAVSLYLCFYDHDVPRALLERK